MTISSSQPNPTDLPAFYRFLVHVAKWFRKDLPSLSFERQSVAVSDIIASISILPLLIAGIGWLSVNTDWRIFRQRPLFILYLFLLLAVFNHFSFFMIAEIRRNRYGSSTGSFSGVVIWIGLWTFGISIIWLFILWDVIKFFNESNAYTSITAKWQKTRALIYDLTEHTIILQIAFLVYRKLGGDIPLASLSINAITVASAALIVHALLTLLAMLPYFLYNIWIQKTINSNEDSRYMIRFFIVSLSLPFLPNPFSILAAFLNQNYGIAVFTYFIIGLVIIAYFTRSMSWAAESSRQQSRIIKRLEQLSRAIILSPPENSNLPQILHEYLPNMFPAGRLAIIMLPDTILYKHPDYWQLPVQSIRETFQSGKHRLYYRAKDPLPWNHAKDHHDPAIMTPIIEIETSQVLGGIYLELYTLAQPWDKQALQELAPAVQSLAAQIASAYNQTKMYERAIELNRVSEEVRLAGEIQASLLPNVMPEMKGWQISVAIHPARETSGDFFDIIPLESNRIGIVIADVLDKGIGPAIYMALSRTLIRTYATEFEAQPDVVFYAVNERILQDTTANLFVTTVYGILETFTGWFTYSNAGHNPPYLVSMQNAAEPIALESDGIPLGIDEATWESHKIQIKPGDTLVLYTDGITEAQNEDGDFFKTERLLAIIKQNLDKSAEELQRSILDAVYKFIGDNPQSDDITLVILKRNPE